MKSLVGAALMACLVTAQGAEKLEFKTEQEKASYAYGVNLGKQARETKLDLDSKMLLQGISDAFNSQPTAIPENQASEVIRNYRMANMKKQAEAGKKEGEAFLAENKKKEGIKTFTVMVTNRFPARGAADTPPEPPKSVEMQYKVLKEGTGPFPKDTDTVSVHYRGTFINGTEFDSSYKRDEPTEFPVGAVIPGWTESLKRMKVGSKWQLFIPSDLAYGDMGRPPAIPPASTLLFEVELLEIKAAGGKPKPQ